MLSDLAEPVTPLITRWTEAVLVNALRSRYAANEWALVTQVRDGAGWDRRTFDAIAIGLWSSRGHSVHGFECKISKSDWKRELAKPEKAEPLAAFCDYWWVVAPPNIVDPLTLPVGWGLLTVGQRGTVSTTVQAAQREVKAPTMGFVAQLAKRVLAERPAQAELDAADQAGYKRGVESAERQAKWNTEHWQDEVKALREGIRVFEEVTGLSIGKLDRFGSGLADLRRYAEVVRNVIATDGQGWNAPREHLRRARDAAEKFIARVDAEFPPEPTAEPEPEPAPVAAPTFKEMMG